MASSDGSNSRIFSPRQNVDMAEVTPEAAAAAPTPRSGLLGSLSKMLWSPTAAEGGGAAAAGSLDVSGLSPPPALNASSSFMTQSPRRGGADPASPSPMASPRFQPATSAAVAAAAEPSAVAAAGSGTGGGDSKRSGLLDTLFSPVFTLFGSRGGDTSAASGATGAGQPHPQHLQLQQQQQEAAAREAAAQAAAEEAQATARAQAARAAAQAAAQAQAAAAAAAAQQQQQQQQQQRGADDDLEEFDPYVFIRNLPAQPPPLTRPVCLPKRTRGTPPISLVLDLDETLLHSSIVPLPTYDIVFPVHFNQVNYQVYVRKRPHVDEFMERVSKVRARRRSLRRARSASPPSPPAPPPFSYDINKN